MITGFNTNVRHCGKLYHVQTEDSGRERPHVISHLYHGGTILGSEKTEYVEQVGSEDLDEQVRALMEKQHLSMVARLKAGEFDAVIAERLGESTASGADDVTPPPPVLEGSTPSPPAVDDVTPAPPVLEGSTPSPPAVDDGTPPPPAALRAHPAAESPGESDARAFGEGIVSQKPLDEVILEYLVEKSRDRPQRGARRSRSKE
jgi:hypothetical protein